MAETYRIGEAAELLHLKTYVLRFWETEFPAIAPLRTEKGQRLYTREHLALLERIRFLLHERGLTIEGARKVLAEEKSRGVAYAFGVPGALAQPDPWPGGRDSGPCGPEGAQEDGPNARRNLPLPVFRDDSFSFCPPAATPPAAPSGPAYLSGQCNLPGIQPVFTADANVAGGSGPVYGVDNGNAEEYFPFADGQEGGKMALGSFDALTDKRMLPLFAVAKAAYLAGRAAGPEQDDAPFRAGASQGDNPGASAGIAGGSNFIAAGASSAREGKRPDGPNDRQELLGLAGELEALAALLRGQ